MNTLALTPYLTNGYVFYEKEFKKKFEKHSLETVIFIVFAEVKILMLQMII